MSDYPLIQFSLRDRDTMRNEGFGNSNLPAWVLAGQELDERCRQLSEGFSAVSTLAENHFTRQRIAPFAFNVTIGRTRDARHALHSSKTKRQKISELFNIPNVDALIGLTGNDELVVQLVSREHAATVSERLADKERNATGLSLIEAISPYKPKIVEAIDECARYKLKLIDFQSESKNTQIKEMVRKALGEQRGYECEYADGFSVFCIDGKHAKALCDRFADEGILQSFEPMPIYTARLDEFATTEKAPVRHRSGNQTYPRVGVLDSGISPCPSLSPWIIGKNAPSYPEEYIDRLHGTMVGGIISYGDMLEGKNWSGIQDGVELFDATIIPCRRESVYEDELVNNIREALDKHHGEARTWNLSVSIKGEVTTNAYSDFGRFLDSVQEKHNILICKSAGNSDAFLRDEPPRPLSVGADSVLSLVVGSIAHEKSNYDLSGIGKRSPFSCIGPGPESNVKPELVHYGGNAGRDPGGRMTITGVKTISPGGQTITAPGTSFATPRISSMAAALFHELGPTADPLLIKAMLVHSARYTGEIPKSGHFPSDELGYGIPQPVPEILHSNPDEITLILRDRVLQHRHFEIIDFPMPSLLIDEDLYDADFKITLTTKPVLDESQGLEYCQSDVEVRFGTFGLATEHDTVKTRRRNPVTIKDTKDITDFQLFSRNAIKRNSDYAYERTQIEDDLKYCPVKKCAIKLSELKSAGRSRDFTKDRHWFLSLKARYRQHIQQHIDKGIYNTPLEFCLILTVRDPRRQGQLYNQMINELHSKQFTHEAIRLHADNRITIRG